MSKYRFIDELKNTLREIKDAFCDEMEDCSDEITRMEIRNSMNSEINYQKQNALMNGLTGFEFEEIYYAA